jgi:hypothetical protein
MNNRGFVNGNKEDAGSIMADEKLLDHDCVKDIWLNVPDDINHWKN